MNLGADGSRPWPQNGSTRILSFKVTQAIESDYDFLLAAHSNPAPISYRFRDLSVFLRYTS